MASLVRTDNQAREIKARDVRARDVQAREVEGWRTGRPVEDPAKTKTWGFVSAKPSEYLVHVRGGAVRSRSSGQGTTCFKWPWDSVAIVPTSLQQVRFRADQVTIERVGVEITGLAVFRIAEPLLAYRVLNFSYPERAQEKLESTLTEMFMGSARRLIANLTVDECLQKRKSALAVELIREISPVVGGTGRVNDPTDKGWGVVIDTIEIQEVRVMSSHVFASMQAPFRASLEQRAREATADANREIALREAACNRSVEEARITTERSIEEARIATSRSIEEARIATQLELENRRRAVENAKTVAELDAAELRGKALASEIELERIRGEAAREERRAQIAITTAEGKANAEVAWVTAQAEQLMAEARAKVITAEKLPELAAAFGERIGEVRITQMGGDGNPFAQLTQGVSAVLDLVKQAGH